MIQALLPKGVDLVDYVDEHSIEIQNTSKCDGRGFNCVLFHVNSEEEGGGPLTRWLEGEIALPLRLKRKRAWHLVASSLQLW